MPSFGVLFEPACSSAGRRPGRCVDDLVLAVNEVPTIGGMDDGAGPEVSGQAQNWTGDAPGFGWRRGPARTRPPVPPGLPGSPTDWPARLTVPARDRRAPPGRALGAAGW